MGFASEMADMATELLTEFDERTTKAKLITLGAKTFVDGEYVFAANTEQELTGVASSYSNLLVNGTTIQASDVKFVATNAVEPIQSDKVLLDGSEYSIISINPYAYTGADKTIAYAIQLRK